MKRYKTASGIHATLLLGALLAPSAAPAQEDAATPDDAPDGDTPALKTPAPAPPAVDQQPRSAAEMVTEYLEQDIFLRPGVGLKKVRIGMSFEEVLAAWGEPTSRGSHNLVDNKWTYELDDDSRITLTGGGSVKTMRIQGGIGTPYTTTEGASFGMARHQIATIYGAREAQSGEAVSYDERGIGFILDQGQVSEIRIFSPD